MKQLDKGIHAVANIQSQALHAGFKSDVAHNDLALIYFPTGATVSGVFTQNLVKAWPVIHGQASLKHHSNFKAILINSGNANACNGPDGEKTMHQAIQELADLCAIKPSEILMSSTGVIGAPLDFFPFKKALPTLVNSLQSESSQAVSESIMTTDTVAKETAYSLEIDGQTVHIGAMAKGSGMIHPNLGTMLAYIVTDIACDQATLNQLLKNAVDVSFNSMTVDGDTSTNDTVLLCATGENSIDLTDHNLATIQSLITKVSQDLAQMIARDGEGASKFITITVGGAQSTEDAKAVAKSLATSNLLKAALFGQDPNWGRALSAIGNSGVETLDPWLIDIIFKSDIGSIQPCRNGAYHPFDPQFAQKILTATDIEMIVELNQGTSQATVWTCDLTHDYIEINADYHT